MEKSVIRNILILLVAACTAASVFISCSGDRVLDQYGVTSSIDSLVTGEFPGDAPGAVVMVSRGDTMVYSRAVGLARLDSVSKLSDHSMLNIASSTKTFTAAAILKLAEQGKLSLDDKITKYYPSLNDSVFGVITLRHILANTSGIPDGRPSTPEQWQTYLKDTKSVFGTASDFRIYGKEKELTRFIEKVDSLRFSPGSGFDRQDPPYMLLLKVIEQASGHTFENWMAENIFAPAGVDYAAYISSDRPIVGMAHAYRKADGKRNSNVFRSGDGRWDEYDYGEADFFLTRSDRGLYMSPRDFTKAIHALHDGKIISKESLDFYHTPMVTSGAAGQGYSLGLNIMVDDSGREKLYHRSTRGGFVAVEAFYPQADVLYLIFSNRNDWDYNTFADKIEAILHEKGMI